MRSAFDSLTLFTTLVLYLFLTIEMPDSLLRYMNSRKELLKADKIRS